MSTDDFENFIDKAFSDKKLMRKVFTKKGKDTNKTPCPSDEIMADFITNKVSPKLKETVEAHIACCDDCMAFVDLSSDFLEEEMSTAKKQKEPAKEFIQNTIPRFVLVVKSFSDRIASIFQDGGFNHILLPAPAMVRNIKSSREPYIISMTRELPPYKFDMEIEKSESDLYYLRISICYLSGEPSNNIRLNLLKDNEEYYSYLTKDGKVSFDELEQGKYIIRVINKGEKVCEFDISLV